MYDLTPVEMHGRLLFKRDDLYEPYGKGDVNGGKLRQCRNLIEAMNPEGVVTACSIHSPQAPICAAVAREFGIPCYVFYGGTSKENLLRLPMPKLAMEHGAKILIAAKTGRHNVLYAKAKEFAERNGYFVVEYGFNIIEHPEIMFGAVARQVENIPNDVERLAITCGSGITASGVLQGIETYKKPVKELHLFCTAPDRSKRLSKFKPSSVELIYHDLFHKRGFFYEKEEPAVYAGIELHPNYEAKAMREFVNLGIPTENTLFWIVGSKPKVVIDAE